MAEEKLVRSGPAGQWGKPTFTAYRPDRPWGKENALTPSPSRVSCPAVRALRRRSERPFPMPQPFQGLTEADFNAYHPSRATSNAYVRPRIPVKEALLTIGRTLAERARAAGFSLDVLASDEHPSIWNKRSVTEQWVYLCRDRQERATLERVGEMKLGTDLLGLSPACRHVFLGLYLNVDRFEVTLRLHPEAWADVKNVRRRLEIESGRAALTESLRALPVEFALGVDGGQRLIARQCEAEQLTQTLDAAVAQGTWWYLSRTLSRAEAIEQGPALQAWIEASFDALLPVYGLVAWRHEEDLAEVAALIAREQAAREAQAAEAAAREAERRARLAAEQERQRAQTLEEVRAQIAVLDSPRPRMPSPAKGTGVPSRSSAEQQSQANDSTHQQERRPSKRSRPEHEPSRPKPPGKERKTTSTGNVTVPRSERARSTESAPSRAESTEWKESDQPVTLGMRVRIRTGPFAGKIGTVVELDAKGLAKVSLGLLSARVPSQDLTALVPRA